MENMDAALQLGYDPRLAPVIQEAYFEMQAQDLCDPFDETDMDELPEDAEEKLVDWMQDVWAVTATSTPESIIARKLGLNPYEHEYIVKPTMAKVINAWDCLRAYKELEEKTDKMRCDVFQHVERNIAEQKASLKNKRMSQAILDKRIQAADHWRKQKSLELSDVCWGLVES